ncbi:hypothetical protein, partial [uncultured Senegalimassilia sp.]|uniref:hypothetical protein n=1 Tax=uncultured Senegalimassilia sp. TaxID=1714350 RepID=UPI0025F2A22F
HACGVAATGSNQTLAIVGLIYGNCMQQGLSMFYVLLISSLHLSGIGKRCGPLVAGYARAMGQLAAHSSSRRQVIAEIRQYGQSWGQ